MQGFTRSAIFISVFIITLICAGVISDTQSIPPDFGSFCRHAEMDTKEKTPLSERPSPPPAVDQLTDESVAHNQQIAASGSEVEVQIPDYFEWNQLSPRAGFGLTGTRDVETWARRLGAGWYIDWTVRERFPTQHPEHWQMVRLGRGCVYPSRQAIVWLASHYPGGVWIIGNEPDNIYQDNLVPEEYAQVYNDLYYLIKDADPTALLAVGGVTQGTPLRLAYLDRVLTIYQALYDEQMPVDWWTVHGFVLREERGNWGAEIPAGLMGVQSGQLYEIADFGNLEIFKEQITAFRAWMANRGYRNTPLAITEFGLSLYSDFGYTPDVVAQYLWDTFTWLGEASDAEIGYPLDDGHLVQRWAWFSLYERYYPTSNLADMEADGLTEIGQAFRAYNWLHRP